MLLNKSQESQDVILDDEGGVWADGGVAEACWGGDDGCAGGGGS